jgi:putative salt-induced outer membrane protein YdiY
VPAIIALAGGRASLQRPCRSLACLQAAWDLPPPPLFAAEASRDPFAIPRPLPTTTSYGLHAPASSSDWLAAYGSNWRLGARYGVEAIRQPDTQLRIEVGSGYRLQPYVDDGTASTGPVARGSIEWMQRFGQRALLSQQLRVETGRHDTFVRNALALDILLQRSWTLSSSVELRHDSAADDTATRGSLQLRYAF